MPENKTKPTTRSVDAFLKKVTPAAKRADCIKLTKMMKRVTGKPPKMWGPSMVGFGSFFYKYASGHSGTIFKVGFSPRKSAITLYFMTGLLPLLPELNRLGKHKAGKGCLHIRSLEDVDLGVLTTMIEKGAKKF